MKHKRQIQKRIQYRRFYRRIRSKLKRKLGKNGNVSITIRRKYNLTRRFGRGMYRITNWQSIIIPEKFCLIEDHNETLKFLETVRKILKNKRPANLEFDHSNTKIIGLAASFLFDKIIRQYIDKWKKQRYFINQKGKLTDSRRVNNFLLSFGLLNELGIKLENISKDLVDKDYNAKFLTYKKTGTNKIEKDKADVSTELTDYFNSCLRYNGFELTTDGSLNLIGAFSEIVGNAQEHAHGTGNNATVEWYALGCYDKDTKDCSFAIVNFGKSIFENLSDTNSTTSDVIERVKKIIQSNSTFVKRFNSEEPIWNVMALQEGISSKRTSKGKGSTRGQGMIDVLELIGKIINEKEKNNIAIISGYSKILVDYTYKIVYNEVMSSISSSLEKRRQIIFNKGRSLHEPQDENYVKVMKIKFPGTIITGKFHLDKQFLDSHIINGKE